MKDFARKTAVVTGGGSGIGRELALQLVAEGCDVAICDLSAADMTETERLCSQLARGAARIVTFQADVSNEASVIAFSKAVRRDFGVDHIHLLINNAGIASGNSFVAGDRSDWERTFNVCWFGVYFCTRAFLPMLQNATEGHVINVSSLNGLWASAGLNRPHTAYSAAKFAVRGFTEALINDFALHAPHIKCSVAMPGHVGTSIIRNTHGIRNASDVTQAKDMDVHAARRYLASLGFPTETQPDGEVRAFMQDMARQFADNAPTSAADAARAILEGVRAERWRILIGKDVEIADRLVRETPEQAYDPEFYERIRRARKHAT